jgi:putative flippase GtrA
MLPHTSSDRARAILARILRFAATSGTGLAIDLLLFYALITTGLSPENSNFCSASSGVLYVFFASLRRVFQHEGHYLAALLLSYVGFQLVAVVAASAAIGVLAPLLGSPVLSKLLILPVTFGANFLFMSLIVHWANRKNASL